VALVKLYEIVSSLGRAVPPQKLVPPNLVDSKFVELLKTVRKRILNHKTN